MARFPGCVRFLDETLGTNYREHMFLQNPLVPETVRKSMTRLISITNNTELRAETFASKYQEYSVLTVSIEETANLALDKTLELQLQEVLNVTKCNEYYNKFLA